MKYDKNESVYDEPDDTTVAEEAHLRLFEDLVRGFNKHLDMFDQGSDLRPKMIKHFQIATCNEGLTKARFGLSFDPKAEPDWFRECE